MDTELQEMVDTPSYRRLCLITLVASAACLAVVYSVWLPLKLAGLGPAHFTWMTVFVAPLLMCSMVCGIIVGPWLVPHRLTVVLVAAGHAIAIGAAMFLDRLLAPL